MTEQEMRRRMHQAMDARLSGLQEDPWLAQRAMNQPKGEKKVKRFTIQTVLAMMLLLAIMGTVYAASLNSAPDDLITNTPVPASEGMGGVDQWAIVERAAQKAEKDHWMLPDYFRWSGVELPEDFTTGFDQDLTQEFGGFRFHIRDAYVNGNTVLAITEITRTDGEAAIVLMWPTGWEKDLVRTYYKNLSDVDMTLTLGEYVEKKNIPVYAAVNFFGQSGRASDGGGMEWFEGEGKGEIQHEYATNLVSENGVMKIDWEVAYWDEIEDKFVWTSMPIELPVVEVQEKLIDVYKTINVNGVDVELQLIRLYENALDIEMDIVFRLVNSKEGDEEKMKDMYFYPINPKDWSIPNPGTMHPIPKTILNDETLAYVMERETYSKSAIQDGVLYLQMLPEKNGEKVKPDPDAPVIAVRIR